MKDLETEDDNHGFVEGQEKEAQNSIPKESGQYEHGNDSDDKYPKIVLSKEEGIDKGSSNPEINTEKVISPAPTGLKVIKKRKLPAWMQNSSPAKNPKTLC